jgi:hypothetical protein
MLVAESRRLWFPGQNPLSVPLLFPRDLGLLIVPRFFHLSY